MRIKHLFVLSLILLGLIGCTVSAQATAKIHGYVKTTVNLNLREKAATSSKRVCSIPSGKQVPYFSTKTVNGAAWYQVSYKSYTGWIMGKYTKKVATYTTTTTSISKPITVKDESKTMQIYSA